MLKTAKELTKDSGCLFPGRPDNRYEGAVFSPRRSTLWSSVQSARFDAGASTRTELVRRSRYFEKNSDIYNRLADLFECYTVGCGLRLSPASSDPDWNAAALEEWQGWSRLPDLTSRQSLGTLWSLLARSWFVDGESFVILTRGESNRPRLQVIEGHMVQTPPKLQDQEGTSIMDGVRIDTNGRPVGYYIGEDVNQNGRREMVFREPTPADFVVHVFEPSRPGQYRGLPFCYPVINKLHDLDDLQLLEMDACKDAAKTTKTINTETGELSDMEFRRQQLSGSKTLNSGEDVSEERATYFKDVLGAETVVLRPDEKYEQFMTQRPSVATKEFWRCLKEDVCAGIGIPYVLAYPDSMQGTVYRGALDMANAFFRARSQVLIDALLRTYEYVISAARLYNPRLRDLPGDWRNATVQPPRAVNVDVGRNSAAMLAELEAGATNYELIYSPLGLDWREVFRQRAAEEAFIKELGLTFAAGNKPQEQPADNEDDVVPQAQYA